MFLSIPRTLYSITPEGISTETVSPIDAPIRAVSYTHLDVYKRQGSVGTLTSLRVATTTSGALSSYRRVTSWAVSYTHLDVYKRQVIGFSPLSITSLIV